jgi:hypothetical protein
MKVNVPSNTIRLTDEYLKSFKSIHKISIPKSVISLPLGAFYNQVNLSKVFFHKEIKLSKIPESCFQGCIHLTNLFIPESVISIERFAFKDTTSIKEFDIPESVEFIDPDAFCGWGEHQIIYVYNPSIISFNQCKAEIVLLKEIEEKEEVSDTHYMAVLKGGHVGKDYFMPMYIPVRAHSKKEASDKVRWLPRVKKDHKDVVLNLYKVSKEVFYKQVEINRNDPYYKAQSKQEQNMFDELIQSRVVMETRKTTY